MTLSPGSTRHPWRVPFAIAALLVAVSCTDSFPPGPGPVTFVQLGPDSVLIVQGDTVRLSAFPLDPTMALLVGRDATWSSSAPAVATVDGEGLVQAVAAGTAVITATVSGVSGNATVAVEPLPAIVFSPAGIVASGTAGSGTAVMGAVTVTNGGGGTLTGLALGQVTYATGQPTGWLTAASLSGTTAPATLSVAAVPGSLPAGSYRAMVPVTASVASNTPLLLDVNFTVNPSTPGSIQINDGEAQIDTVNAPVAIPPSVLVRDAFNNPTPNAMVTFAPGPGSGSVTGANQMTDANGIARVGSWTLGTAAGPQTLIATSGTIMGSPLTITATAVAGPPSTIAASPSNPPAAVVATAATPAPGVLVTDDFGNPVSDVQVDFALASGGGSVSGTSQTTDAGGFAAVASWTMGPARGPNTLTATSGSLAGSPLTLTVQGTWSLATHVQPQILDNCLGCHNTGGISPVVPDGATSYQSLLNGNGTMTRYVTPGDTTSDGSTFGILLFRLKSTGAPMPPGTPLSVADPTLYSLIRDWVLDGALP